MIIDIIYWIMFMLIWAWILKYRKIVKSWTWNFVWAEQYLGRGWTYSVIILFWLSMLFLGVLYPFWWLELIISGFRK